MLSFLKRMWTGFLDFVFGVEADVRADVHVVEADMGLAKPNPPPQPPKAV